MADNAQDINEYRRIRREKLAALQEAGRDPFAIVRYGQTHHTAEVVERFEELETVPETDAEGKQIVPALEELPQAHRLSLAGRLMGKRVMGKASFANLQDRDGRIQLYVSRNDLGDDAYAEFKKLDIGDIIGVRGFAFRTKAGEISVHVLELTLLSKSLIPLPEKFHGLTDTEIRYRQRYLDLIMNRGTMDTFRKRSRIISEIRSFLAERDFIEVETPMLVENAGGAAARPFITHYNALDEDRKLRISLELYLKRLIIGGMERVFEIGRVFRNEGTDTKHNPEFTLMELYQAYTDYNGMMDLTERMFRHVAKEVTGSARITYAGVEIDLEKPFRRLTMVDAIKQSATSWIFCVASREGMSETYDDVAALDSYVVFSSRYFGGQTPKYGRAQIVYHSLPTVPNTTFLSTNPPVRYFNTSSMSATSPIVLKAWEDSDGFLAATTTSGSKVSVSQFLGTYYQASVETPSQGGLVIREMGINDYNLESELLVTVQNANAVGSIIYHLEHYHFMQDTILYAHYYVNQFLYALDKAGFEDLLQVSCGHTISDNSTTVH